MFQDYNCDGFEDVFAGEANGITVFKNNGDFSFSEGIKIQSETENGLENIFVSGDDIPGISDIDGDGDIDILTFESNGSFIELHENISIDNFNSCGLSFSKTSNCWGQIKESDINNTILLNQDCSEKSEKTLGGGLHAGSTITIIDHNKDGKSDVIIGDLTSSSMFLLTNSSENGDKIVSIDMNFPIDSKPININIFPYASYVDENHDNQNDLIIASNNKTSGDNSTILFYENTGEVQDEFSYKNDIFLVGEMLDFGTCAYPIFVDENKDGLTDILVGNNSLIEDGEKYATLTLLRNTGTVNNPIFEIINEDYLGFSTSNESYLYPAIGDIDNDGDNDLLIGLESGKILYYNNQAGQNESYKFILASGNFEGIDVGKYAAPILFDINRDGNIDLLSGNQDGSLNYFENQNSNGFDFSVEQKNWGNVSTQELENGYFYGYSTPHIFKTDSNLNLIVGGESGKIQLFQNIGEEINSELVLDETNFCSKDGGFSKPIMSDLNNDGYLDLITGNISGGLAYHKGIHSNTVKMISNDFIHYSIVNKKIHFQIPNIRSVRLFDINGRLLDNSSSENIDVPNLRGTYLILVELKDRLISAKFVK